MTHRALVISALADGRSKLGNALVCSDTLSTVRALNSFGIATHRRASRIEVEGKGGRLSPPSEPIDVGNSGTTLRFITSLAGLVPGRSVITGDESIRSRPMGDLINCLASLGVRAVSIPGTGRAPIDVMGSGRIGGGDARITGSVSSQFISSLLIPSPHFEKGLRLEVVGEMKSRPYVELTIKVMEDFGVHAAADGNVFCVRAGQRYHSLAYFVDGDYSSASFLMAAAAVTGSKIRIGGLRQNSLQADEAFVSILERMGCTVKRKGDALMVEGGELKGIDVDLSDSPDLLPPLSVLASLAKGSTTIRGVEHARFKESDRIAVIRCELARLGIGVEERPDGLLFRGGDRPKPGEAFSHGDHRIAMALAVLGLACEGLVVRDASCISVSYPTFVQDLTSLGADLRWL